MLQLKAKLSLFLLQIAVISTAFGQTGPGGVGMNDGTSSLKLWLDAGKMVFMDTLQNSPSANGARVMLWKDLSGNNNDVKAERDSTSPILEKSNPLLNNQNTVRFLGDKANRKKTYLFSDSFSNTNDITIYCVFHALSRGGGNNITPVKANDYSPDMWYYGAGLVDAGTDGITNDISLTLCDTSLAAGAGDLADSIDYCVKNPAAINKSFFATLEKEAWTGNLSVGKNGGTPSTLKAGAQPINKATRYFIGSTSNTRSFFDTTFFNGYIANVLVFNGLLTMAERIILHNYLSSKYNIPLEANDIYTFDDSREGNFDFDVIGIGMAKDGSKQTQAKGEGLIELSNANDLSPESFAFIGNDGKSLNMKTFNNPDFVTERIERNWVYSKTGNIQKVDFTIDAALVPGITKEDLALLIDTDNNGDFSNETFGKGVLPVSELTANGRYAFRGLNLTNGNRFTFAKLKPVCKENCDVFFTPNGDGFEDEYYLPTAGKTSIYDRSGKLVKNLSTPAFWDGTDDSGMVSSPGIYFLITNEQVQQTVTIIR